MAASEVGRNHWTHERSHMNWVRISRILGGASISLFFGIAFTPLPEVLARWEAVSPQLEPADVIVVLAGGSVSPSGVLTDIALRRTIHGVLVFQKGLAPFLVLSAGSAKSPKGAEARAELARTLRVPGEAILIVAGSRTTHEEVVRIQFLLRPRGVRTMLLVTDAEHMSRAKRLFERAGFEVLAAPVNAPESAREPGNRLDLFRRTAREMLALLYYRLAGYL